MSKFEAVRLQVDILDLACKMLKRGKGFMFYYPGEKTPSIRVHPETQSFYDFGRAKGGDCFTLYSHINGCNNWQALQAICALYGLETPDKGKDRQQLAEAIKQQQRERQRVAEEKEQQRLAWLEAVERLKDEECLLQSVLSGHVFVPLTDDWCWCVNRLTTVSGQLDLLCGID